MLETTGFRERRIPIASVLLIAIATAKSHALSVELANGDRLHGELLRQDETSLTLTHPVLGEITLPRSGVVAIHDDKPSASNDTQAAAGKAPAPQAQQDQQAWKWQLAAGLTGTNGKSDDVNLHLEFNADFENLEKRWKLRSRYDRNQSDGVLSDHSFYADLKRDWLLPGSPWFRFAGVRYDWDDFGDWDHRISANGGTGYAFVDRERLRVLGRAGLGGQQTFGGIREQFTPEALIGAELTWKLSAVQTLHLSNTLYPSLDDRGEYRNQTDIEWTIDLDRTMGLGLKFSVSNEYDSLAEQGDWNDVNYAGSLLWKL